MSISKRDRVKVQAALVALHDAGVDTREVTRTVEILVKSGTPTRKAYDTAFNKFVQSRPDMAAPLQRLGKLVESTDNRTLASYSLHLSRYIETGERSALEAVMPTLQADLLTMAQRTGDAGYIDGLPEHPAPQSPSEENTSPEPVRPGHGVAGYSPQSARAAETQGPHE